MARLDDIPPRQAEFGLLRELFNETCGILFGAESRPFFERRLRDRLAALGLRSFGEYYQFLRFDERGRAELEEAINLVTINETYFFREAYQIRAYQEEILPALRSSPRAALGLERGCSTGEEVYSIAVATRESGALCPTAACASSAATSRAAASRARAAASTAPRPSAPCPSRCGGADFVDRPDGAHVVDDFRGMCQFGHLNLLDVRTHLRRRPRGCHLLPQRAYLLR